MASVRREIQVAASPEAAWDAIRDVGALHTRLVPGFVTDTKLEPGARIVTFGNGMVVRELIVDLDEAAHRLVWSARSDRLTHHNASVQVFDREGGGATIVWIADFLPDTTLEAVGAMIEAGAGAIEKTLNA